MQLTATEDPSKEPQLFDAAQQFSPLDLLLLDKQNTSLPFLSQHDHLAPLLILDYI